MLNLDLFSLLFCIVYCIENRLKINITSFGENFYQLTYQDTREVFYRLEIMGWSSHFPEITETWWADALEMTCNSFEWMVFFVTVKYHSFVFLHDIR